MDVDGTLTDGSIFIGEAGEVMKRFHVRDGYAIKHILPGIGITPVILTGRESQIVAQRCRELDIRWVIQGSQKKLEDLKALLARLGAAPEEAAYIGDDLNDADCMRLCGVCGCPGDAVIAIREIADFVAEAKGGYGAVREFIEWLGKRNEENTDT